MSAKILYTDLMEFSTDELAQADWVTDAEGLELDYMEYSSDENAQSAYVSDGNYYLIDSYSEINQDSYQRLYAGFTIVNGQAITLASVTFIRSVKFYLKKLGNPAGNAVVKLYATTGTVGIDAKPTGDSLATSNNLNVSTLTTDYVLYEITFASPYLASAGDIAISLEYNGGDIDNCVYMGGDWSTPSHSGNIFKYTTSWLTDNTGDLCFYLYGNYSIQCYSENSIKNQGSYSLKVVAKETESLNDTLTKSGLSLDLSDIDELKIDFYASRTGTNIQIQLLQESGDDSDLFTGGTPSASSTYPAFEPAKAFDGIPTLYWASAAGQTSGWLKYDLGSEVTEVIQKYSIQTIDVAPPGIYAPTDWTFEGSNNDSDWDVLDTQSDITTWTNLETKTYVCSNTTAYRYYRLNISDNNGGSVIAITEFKGLNTISATYTKDIAISQANTWETTTWDISGISNANKDNINTIIIKVINSDADNTFYVDNFRANLDLQCYSEDSIVQQGTYSLKIEATIEALNNTLTKTLTDYLDYSIMDVIRFDIRASRTGSNIKIKIHDIGGTTSEHTINIAQADTWQTEDWDISGIATADRDTIDKIIIEIINADSANEIYIDNLYTEAIVEHSYTFLG